MTENNDKTPAEQLKDLRAILAAIQREAANKGVTEIIDLVEKADELAADLQQGKAG